MEISQTQLTELIQAQFSSIVPELQDFILSTDLNELLTGICESYEVPDAIDRVHNDVTLTLLGIVSVESFNERLAAETGLSETDADAMASDILTTALVDVIGFIPQELSPTAQALADEYTSESSKRPILQATRTMQKDMEESGDGPRWRTLDEDKEGGVQEESGVDAATGATSVPRYAKPLTDTPKYE